LHGEPRKPEEIHMQGNSDQEASSSQDAPSDLHTSNGEVVRRDDLDQAAGTGKFARDHPSGRIAGKEGIRLAKAAIAGDQAVLDEFHALAGLALPGVSEYGEGEPVRLVMREVKEEIWPATAGSLGCQRSDIRAAFQATNDWSHDRIAIDAAELVAWILSSDGQAALARRGVVVPALAKDLPAGTLTPDEAVVAARNVGVDLTCGECAALFYTGYPSAPGHPPAHDPSCGTGVLAAVWRRDVPPRGVRCLVTWTGQDGCSPPRIRIASVSPDYDEERWFSDGERLFHVIAWMPAPEAARDEATS
jgi:hypothetical protein